MEKRKPHYDLLTVQSAVRLRGADAFTATALIGAQAMGLEIAQAIEVVCSMSRSDFYKSMTTHASSKIWQDVYHVEWREVMMYLKFTIDDNGYLVVSFKAK